MKKDRVSTYHAPHGAAWRGWLEQNHVTGKSVWLIIYRRESVTPSVYYDEGSTKRSVSGGSTHDPLG